MSNKASHPVHDAEIARRRSSGFSVGGGTGGGESLVDYFLIVSSVPRQHGAGGGANAGSTMTTTTTSGVAPLDAEGSGHLEGIGHVFSSLSPCASTVSDGSASSAVATRAAAVAATAAARAAAEASGHLVDDDDLPPPPSEAQIASRRASRSVHLSASDVTLLDVPDEGEGVGGGGASAGRNRGKRERLDSLRDSLLGHGHGSGVERVGGNRPRSNTAPAKSLLLRSLSSIESANGRTSESDSEEVEDEEDECTSTDASDQIFDPGEEEVGLGMESLAVDVDGLEKCGNDSGVNKNRTDGTPGVQWKSPPPVAADAENVPPPSKGVRPPRPQRQRSTSVKNIRPPGGADDAASDFEIAVTGRYPPDDIPGKPLNPMVVHFCHPRGHIVELIAEYKLPHVHHFVLTDESGSKTYGTCLTVYEECFLDGRNGKEGNDSRSNVVELYRGSISDDADNVEVAGTYESFGRLTFYVPKVLCLVSSHPYFTSLREYLVQLYRLATTTDLMTAPIERYVRNICEDIPVPRPGKFDVKLSILDETIWFKPPPPGRPAPYLTFPLAALFECLDTDNVLTAWYALALERKVLLVSSQDSLLTVCAEALTALLFPMQWSHIYVPVLPRFLAPMLDAPMPYLCGLSRSNFAYAVGSIGNETLVVDLDKNLITRGPNTPDLPAIPSARLERLKKVLETTTTQVFWNARGLAQSKVFELMADQQESAALDEALEAASAVWEKKLRRYDMAYNLKYIPGVPHPLGDDFNPSVRSLRGGLSRETSTASDASGHSQDWKTKEIGTVSRKNAARWDKVLDGFLNFYVSMLKHYRAYVDVPIVTTEKSKQRRSSLTRTPASKDRDKRNANARGGWGSISLHGRTRSEPPPLSEIRGSLTSLKDSVQGSDDGAGGAAFPKDKNNLSWSGAQRFRREAFISSQPSDHRPFLEEFVLTQQFDDFIMRALYRYMDYRKEDEAVLLFDKRIKEGARWWSGKSFRGQQNSPSKQEARALKVDVGRLDAERIDKRRPYVYKMWPDTFDPELFGTERTYKARLE